MKREEREKARSKHNSQWNEEKKGKKEEKK